MLNLTCFLLPLAMLPALISGGIAPRWALLSVMVPLMLWQVDVGRAPYRWLLASLMAYAALSLSWMEVPLDAGMEMWRLALLIGAFAVGSSVQSVRGPLTLMAIGVAITLPLVLLQLAGYQGITQMSHPPAGLFINKNVLAEIAAAMLVAMVYTRQWLIAAALAVIVLVAKEKAAYVALVVAGLVYLWPRDKNLASMIATFCGVVMVALLMAGAENGRFSIWLDTIQGFTLFGHGVGSFWTAFPINATHYDLSVHRPEHAHNEILHSVFEFGIGAAGIWFVVWKALTGRREFERLVFATIIVEGLFSFPLHMPVTAFVAALLAGRLCRDVPDDCGAESGYRDFYAQYFGDGRDANGSLVETQAGGCYVPH